MEEAIKGYYKDLSISYPEGLVNADPALDTQGLSQELLHAYATFDKESKWLNKLINSYRFRGIAEQLQEFSEKGFEIDSEVSLLQYSIPYQADFNQFGYTLSDILVNSQGHNMRLDDIIAAIKHLEFGTPTNKGIDKELRTSEIMASILLLAQPVEYLLPLDDPQDVSHNNSVYILPVSKLKELSLHSTVDGALFQKTAIQYHNMKEATRTGNSEARRISNVASEASKSLFATQDMVSIYKAMYKFARMESTDKSEFRKPYKSRVPSALGSVVKRRYDWFETGNAAENEARMSFVTFNPYWRCIMRILNLGNFHWILLVIVRHGPELQKVSCVVFDSLNLWKNENHIKDIQEMVNTILSCNAVGMATLGDLGAIPRLINGFRKKKQSDSISCGLHAIHYALYVMNYFSTDDVTHISQFSLTHFLDYMNDFATSDQICNGVVKHSIIRGLKFLAVFAHFHHHMTSSLLYKPDKAKTKKELRDMLSVLTLEEDHVEVNIDIACITDLTERPHILRLDNEILNATVDQIIAQCSKAGADFNGRKLYDIIRRRPVPGNIALKEYVKDVYKDELRKAETSRDPLDLYFVTIPKDLQGDAVLKTPYNNVALEVDLGLGYVKRKSLLNSDAQQVRISYDSSVADFNRAALTFVPVDLRPQHVMRFFNKTTGKFLPALHNSYDAREDERIPLLTLDAFHNGDELALILLQSTCSIFVMGFSTPFTDRTEHYATLDEGLDTNFSATEDVSLVDIVKHQATRVPTLKNYKLSAILREYDIYNDRNEPITEDLLYLTWTAYMARMRMSSPSISLEQIGYAAYGSVFLLLIARKGNRPTDGIKMIVKGSDQYGNDYEPFEIDNVSPFMRLSEFNRRVKDAAGIMDEDTPLYYDYVDANSMIGEVTLVSPKKLRKLRAANVADPILLHLGFYNANPTKRHVRFYVGSDA